ncbi:MAG: thiol-disulfide isomerase, partial [Nitrosopumilaceae archaeon]
NQANLEIFLDGVPVDEAHAGSDLISGNTIIVTEPDLYNIITSENSATHELEVKIKGQGFEIYTFTFG